MLKENPDLIKIEEIIQSKPIKKKDETLFIKNDIIENKAYKIVAKKILIEYVNGDIDLKEFFFKPNVFEVIKLRIEGKTNK